MLRVGRKPDQRCVAGFRIRKSLFGMEFTPLLFNLCNARKCEAHFQLRAQKLNAVLVDFSLQPQRFGLRTGRNWKVIIHMTSLQKIQKTGPEQSPPAITFAFARDVYQW